MAPRGFFREPTDSPDAHQHPACGRKRFDSSAEKWILAHPLSAVAWRHADLSSEPLVAAACRGWKHAMRTHRRLTTLTRRVAVLAETIAAAAALLQCTTATQPHRRWQSSRHRRPARHQHLRVRPSAGHCRRTRREQADLERADDVHPARRHEEQRDAASPANQSIRRVFATGWLRTRGPGYFGFR